MNRSDFSTRFVLRHTRMPIATLAAAIALLVVIVWHHDRVTERHAELSVNRSAMHEDYNSLVYRRKLIDNYHRRYESFSHAGFVGVESRLDWVESLRTASLDLALPQVSYAIEPQLRIVTPVESILAGDDITIHLSRLRLEAGLVHEVDLLRMFDQLQRQAPGLIAVDECELTWQAEMGRAVGGEANLLASCSIQIFSVVTTDVRDGAQT